MAYKGNKQTNFAAFTKKKAFNKKIILNVSFFKFRLIHEYLYSFYKFFRKKNL